MLYDLGRMEHYTFPIRLELIRHVFPLLLAVALICTGIGYMWAKTVYTVHRVGSQSISATFEDSSSSTYQPGRGESPP